MKITTLLAATTLVFAGTATHAATLTLDAGYTTFYFDDTGSSWEDTFTFTLAGTGFLTVVDLFNSGDQFEVFVDGISAGLTSAPASQTEYIGVGAEAFAIASPDFSSGEIELGAGTYTISGTAALSPFGSGGSSIGLFSTSQGAPTIGAVVPTVPLPASSLMLLVALGGLAALRRNTHDS